MPEWWVALLLDPPTIPSSDPRHSKDCTGGSSDAVLVRPVGGASAAPTAADGPTVTTAVGFVGAAADFCSGLSPVDVAGLDCGVGGYDCRGSTLPIVPGGRKSGPIHGLS